MTRRGNDRQIGAELFCEYTLLVEPFVRPWCAVATCCHRDRHRDRLDRRVPSQIEHLFAEEVGIRVVLSHDRAQIVAQAVEDGVRRCLHSLRQQAVGEARQPRIEQQKRCGPVRDTGGRSFCVEATERVSDERDGNSTSDGVRAAAILCASARTVGV